MIDLFLYSTGNRVIIITKESLNKFLFAKYNWDNNLAKGEFEE